MPVTGAPSKNHVLLSHPTAIFLPADFYLDVIAGAIARERYDLSTGEPVYQGTDEGFMPRELYAVWERFGRGWLEQEVLKELGLVLVSHDWWCGL